MNMKFYRTICRYLTIFLCAAVISGCGQAEEEVIPLSPADDYGYAEDNSDAVNVAESEDNNGSTIFVYICGEVEKPGVYELPEGSRLYELLQRAGGYTELAAADVLNQAELLHDSQKIVVQSVNQAASETPEAAENDTDRININTADIVKLQQLSGIGQSRAADIIEYREKNGPFVQVEDIMKVPGIKEGMFSKIKDQITV